MKLTVAYASIHFRCVLITSDLAGVVWQPSRMASCSISVAHRAMYRKWVREILVKLLAIRLSRHSGKSLVISTNGDDL
jgi:hypothetical protein